MATYTPSLQRNLGLLNTLQLLKLHNPDETISQLWQPIVTEWFPLHDGYTYRFGVSYIRVIALAPGPSESNESGWLERGVFLVECRRPSSDSGTESNWSDTVNNQFREDLSSTSNDSKRVFGAVAIGKKVRFYRFDGKKPYEQQIVQLHQGTFDMGTPDGIAQVEDMMSYIKENAWQWANF